MLTSVFYPEKEDWQKLLSRPHMDYAYLDALMKEIFSEVEAKGDDALRNYSQRFDGHVPAQFKVSDDEMLKSGDGLSTSLKSAIDTAIGTITRFHTLKILEDEVVETMPGVRCQRKRVPINRVGLYIPGGSAPLFSTVLMLAIPAKLAGCKEIILCSPPSADGALPEVIRYAAKICGITQVFQIGGAQAIAAMAIGTASIPAVDKIYGPGNQFVTAAKVMASNYFCSIDMIAGPSELLVIADDTAVPAFVASDLLSQAEHGSDSQVLLITDSITMADSVKKEVIKQLMELPRAEIASKALTNSRIIILKDIETALEFSNNYSPEHLILAVENAKEWALKVMNAGSVFIGNYSPESAGDYASGTNHTLPTGGFARSSSGITTESFMKTITFQELTAEGLLSLAPTIEEMAKTEQLDGHKNAVALRVKYLNKILTKGS